MSDILPILQRAAITNSKLSENDKSYSSLDCRLISVRQNDTKKTDAMINIQVPKENC